MAILLSSLVMSGPTPEGPTNITVVTSSTKLPSPTQTIEALGGNVSQLSITAYTQTRTWQAYYGNVSGKITLSDSGGFAVYEWDLANPSGQIYASTTQADFSDGNIECYNLSKTGNGYLDLHTYEASLGLNNLSSDGIDETFNETTDYDAFYIGATYINETCPTVYLYNASNASSADTYQEVLLYDNTSNNTVFTSIIKQGGILGFNNQVWDFQMIVAENGRLGDTQTTTYYFYVALE
jgi:hypothetical protein